MTQAQLQLLAGQNEQALASLTRVQASHPQQAQAVRLLIEAYRRLRDWQNLARLLPEARRRQLLPDPELNELERATQHELLSLPLPAGALDTLHRAWSGISERARRHPELVGVYARQLINQNAMDECTALLATALERSGTSAWCCSTARRATHNRPPSSRPPRNGSRATAKSPALLLTLGRLGAR